MMHKSLLLSIVFSLPCLAQAVSGTVTHAATGGPVSGAVVTLIDAAGRRVAMASVSEDGRYRLAAPDGGTYRVRALRIGFRPAEHGPFTITADARLDIALRPLGQLLDTVRVAQSANCIRAGGSSAFAAWQQLQASVASIAATQRQLLDTRIIRQLVVYDPTGRVLRREATVFGGESESPWHSPPLDSLVLQGFVVEDEDGSTTYRAPDLDAMLSDDFAETFCLRLAESTDPSQLGISFTPSTDVKTTSIAGTFWLERRTSRLKRLEFRFTGISPAQRSAGAGGSMDFLQLSNGDWFIARWSLTMPQIEIRLETEPDRRPGDRRRFSNVVAVHVQSGEVALAVADSDTLFALPPATLHGVLRDEQDRPVVGAVVSLEGDSTRTFRTDSSGIFRFDSVSPGVYTVVARDNASRDFAGGKVTMTSTDLELNLRGSPTRSQLAEQKHAPPPERTDGLVLLRGAVRDTAGEPIAHAHVAIQSRASLVADAQGRFSTRIRPGEYVVNVRRIGFAPVTHKVSTRRDTVVHVVMHPTTVRLQDVNVVASMVTGLARDGFYDRMRDRQRGLNVGYFLSPEDIEARPVTRVSQHFERFPGIRMQKFYTPAGRLIGMLPVMGGSGCVMTLYLDGSPLKTDFERGEPDLLITPGSVAAIELYPRGMMLPARFQMLNGTCGVIAIWTKY